MIQVAERIKQQYKSDDVRKSYLIAYRDLGIMQGNSDIVFDSPSITESVCSASNFKVGLCESSTASISVNLPENVEGDEMTIMQALGKFEPSITVDNTKGIAISGENVTLIKEGAFSGTEEVIGIGGETVTRYEYPETVNLTANYSDGGDMSLRKEYVFGNARGGVSATLPAQEQVFPEDVTVTAEYSDAESGLNQAVRYYFGSTSGGIDETINESETAYAEQIRVTARYQSPTPIPYTDADGRLNTFVSSTPIDETGVYTGTAEGFRHTFPESYDEVMLFSRYDGTITWISLETGQSRVQNVSGNSNSLSYTAPGGYGFWGYEINATYSNEDCSFVRNVKYEPHSMDLAITDTLPPEVSMPWYFEYWNAEVIWSSGQSIPMSHAETTISILPKSLTLYRWIADITWSHDLRGTMAGTNNSVSIPAIQLDCTGWSADVTWTDSDISNETGNTNIVTINPYSHSVEIPTSYESSIFYLVLAKLRYTGDEIYLYVESESGASRTIYYLLKDLDLPKGYVQIAIPIIGSEFEQYKSAIYTKDSALSGYAAVYEIGVPLMPLGLYGITSCKKRNDSTVRDLQGYDRMQDTNLSADVHYNLSQTTEISIGQILNTAAATTQIIIGSNMSKDSVEVEVVSTETDLAVPNFPTGVIYEVSKTESANGTVNKNATSPRFQYTEWTTREATVQTTQIERTNSEGFSIPSGWSSSAFIVYQYCQSYYDDFNMTWVEQWYDVNWSYPAGTTFIEDYDLDTNYLRLKRTAAPSTPAGYTFSRNEGNIYYYYRYVSYDFNFDSKYSDTSQWELVSETTSGTEISATSAGTCTRVYKYLPGSGAWSESAIGTRITYRIPDYGQETGRQYTVYFHSPYDYGAIPDENTLIKETVTAESVQQGGSFTINRQSEVRNAIYDFSTHSAVAISEQGVFQITYVSRISYSGSSTGDIYPANTYIGTESSPEAERFNEETVEVANEQIHTTRRAVVSSYLELNGLFIRFDRYGVSTLFKIRGNTLYPAEDLYPHDSAIPGLEEYGDIYPTEGAQEITAPSLCKEIYISDKINRQFDGVKISKSGNTEGDTVSWPFYFNRKNKNYGRVDPLMPEVGYWKGNYYYEISDNFFFNNFTFTQEQLIEICQAIMDNIGDLQYFNMTATIKALPYMEAGDNINIMTPGNGYETAILRRTMKGCSAMMDTFETEFYK